MPDIIGKVQVRGRTSVKREGCADRIERTRNMERDEIIEELKLETVAGFNYAATAAAAAGRPASEEYKLASRDVIRVCSHALGYAVCLFLRSQQIDRYAEPHERYDEQIRQLRHSRHCPLDQSQISTLYDTRSLRNRIEHDKPPDIEMWQVQRTASTVNAVLPKLVPEVPWPSVSEEAWREYRRHFGVYAHGRVPHNLPRPDYIEFIGREEERDRLYKMLEHPRQWIISVDGIGGVGKSALALKVAWEVAGHVKQGDSPWKYLVWVSAKESRLRSTATGIESTNPSFQVLEDLFDEILLVADFPEYVNKDSDTKWKVVKLILESEPFLLFIDNFETIREPSTVYDFLYDLPGTELPQPGHKAILTSRHRQFGRRIRLWGLSEGEAKKLILQIAGQFDVIKQFTEEEVLDRVIKGTGCIPLALRWVVGQVSIGRSVGDVVTKLNQRTEEIHRFCFDATIHELDPLYLKILYVLSQLDSPAPPETVSNISGFVIEDVRDGLFTLQRYSLVNQMREETLDTELYGLLPLTRTYCTDLRKYWPEYAAEVAKRGQDERERQHVIMVANGIFKRYGAYDDETRVAMIASSAALDEHDSGNSEVALDILGHAMSIAPNLGYVHYVRGQILKDIGEIGDARNSFQEAYRLDPNKAKVLRDWAGMELSVGRSREATELLEGACELKPEDASLRLQLAQATKRYAGLCRRRERKREANKLSRAALRHAEAAVVEDASLASEERHNIECYELIIEIYQETGKREQALEFCRKALKLDPTNFSLKRLVRTLESDTASA